MRKPDKAKNWKKAAVQVGVFGLFLLGGYGIGSVIGSAAAREGAALPLVWVVLVSILGVYLVLLTHELGHLLAGKLAGMQPFLLVSGPFKVIANEQGLEFGWNTNLALAGGLAACMPGKGGDSRRQMLALAAGGPLSSLLGGGVGLLGAWLLPPDTLAHLFSLVFGLAGLGIFVATMIPGKTSGFMTDGAQILSLWRGGTEVELRMALLLLQAESMRGTRPSAYPGELLASLRQAPPNSLIGIAGGLYVYYHHLDRSEIAAAQAALQGVLDQIEHVPEGLKQAVYMEQAYFLAAHQGNAAQAAQAMQQSKGALVEAYTRLRCEAALLWAQGKTTEAAAKAAEMARLARRSMDRGAAQAEQEWLARLLASPAPTA